MNTTNAILGGLNLAIGNTALGSVFLAVALLGVMCQAVRWLGRQ